MATHFNCGAICISHHVLSDLIVANVATVYLPKAIILVFPSPLTQCNTAVSLSPQPSSVLSARTQPSSSYRGSLLDLANR